MGHHGGSQIRYQRAANGSALCLLLGTFIHCEVRRVHRITLTKVPAAASRQAAVSLFRHWTKFRPLSSPRGSVNRKTSRALTLSPRSVSKAARMRYSSPDSGERRSACASAASASEGLPALSQTTAITGGGICEFAKRPASEFPRIWSPHSGMFPGSRGSAKCRALPWASRSATTMGTVVRISS